VARGFSGDKQQLVPLIQAGLRHEGFAIIDVLSPCVTFNDHEGSTKSYQYTREHYHPAVAADFVPKASAIEVDYEDSTVVSLHDGSQLKLRKLDESFDTSDRAAAYTYIDAKLREGEHVTGLIHVAQASESELHHQNRSVGTPLNALPYSALNPGSAALTKLMGRYR
jgi:2-oxoglutarate ferredoxin oxidoreductase subunit beta